MTEQKTKAAAEPPLDCRVRRRTARPLKPAQLRKQVGYERDIARCENCTHYHGEMLAMKNSKYRSIPAQCRLHDFFVQPAAICDKWNGKDGSIIDA